MRTRSKISSFNLDKDTIAERIHTFYENDNQDRTAEIDARLQRYAKYRMWTEGKDWPWENASDCAIPDMATASMKMQDTLNCLTLVKSVWIVLQCHWAARLWSLSLDKCCLNFLLMVIGTSAMLR